jgi:glycosyltransferase involved in cell wall biosynthesis
MRQAVSPTLLRLLPAYIRWADVTHLTAVYSFPTIPTLALCKASGKPLVWSPRGALQRWDGSTRPLAKAVWERVCRSLAPKIAALHFTSEDESLQSLRRFPDFKAIVVPNGIELPENVRDISANTGLRLLYLGRLHPIKGIENLLKACEILKSQSKTCWSLLIAGQGDVQYADKLNSCIKDFGLSQQVKMIGEVAGESKQELFENANIVVVPSYTENFGMVVAEALAHGVPVIASSGTPWNRLEEIGCGLWVDNSPDSLAKAIERMNRMPLCEMGQRGREWMQKEFSWDKQAKEMIRVYEDVLSEKTA